MLGRAIRVRRVALIVVRNFVSGVNRESNLECLSSEIFEGELQRSMRSSQ